MTNAPKYRSVTGKINDGSIMKILAIALRKKRIDGAPRISRGG